LLQGDRRRPRRHAALNVPAYFCPPPRARRQRGTLQGTHTVTRPRPISTGRRDGNKRGHPAQRTVTSSSFCTRNAAARSNSAGGSCTCRASVAVCVASLATASVVAGASLMWLLPPAVGGAPNMTSPTANPSSVTLDRMSCDRGSTGNCWATQNANNCHGHKQPAITRSQ